MVCPSKPSAVFLIYILPMFPKLPIAFTSHLPPADRTHLDLPARRSPSFVTSLSPLPPAGFFLCVLVYRVLPKPVTPMPVIYTSLAVSVFLRRISHLIPHSPVYRPTAGCLLVFPFPDALFPSVFCALISVINLCYATITPILSPDFTSRTLSPFWFVAAFALKSRATAPIICRHFHPYPPNDHQPAASSRSLFLLSAAHIGEGKPTAVDKDDDRQRKNVACGRMRGRKVGKKGNGRSR